MNTNEERAERIDAVLMAHQLDDCHGDAEQARTEIESAPQSVVGYVLSDLMHYCDAHGLDFEAALQMAHINHEEEVEEEARGGPVTDDERSYGPRAGTRTKGRESGAASLPGCACHQGGHHTQDLD